MATHQIDRAGQESGFLGVLRTAAAIAVATGAAGSVGLVLHACQRINSPRLVMALFAIWVVSPFVLLGVIHAVSKRWSAPTRATLHGATLVVTVASLAIYGVAALGSSRPEAVAFVLVPPMSSLLLAIAIPAAAFVSRRRSR